MTPLNSELNDAIRTAMAFCLITFRVINDHREKWDAIAVDALSGADMQSLWPRVEEFQEAIAEAGLRELVEVYFRTPRKALNFAIAVSSIWIGLLELGWSEFRDPPDQMLEGMVAKLAAEDPFQ
jgi:hypothetical protein